MNQFWISFKNSLLLPRKKSVFALNRIGMDIVVLYLFLLIAVSSIPNFTDKLTNIDQATIQIHPFFLAIYFFIFHYLILTTIIFIVISLIAYIATLFAKAAGRKLKYNIFWKMVAFSSTIPLLAFTILAFFIKVSENLLYLGILYILFNIIMIIQIYPKRKRRASP
ncbi:MAG TPA: DUF1189 family protein [Pseudogracilibacillus sp.]|nr:DUF1189 family protein [Pseudogracilibacillus sp.]